MPDKGDSAFPDSFGDDVDRGKLDVFVARANAIHCPGKTLRTLNQAEGVRPLREFAPAGEFSSVPDKFIDGDSQIFA
ncbi:hypothetical protein [Burkholderia pseudomultivorans]|uniref:hypothetical protein n=1 Tax=Burkholderia pseudomultivorans TaxID=1207504 RepID=UPI0012D92CE8|nr:hypothetical protein [Burkholderia pseudomultivorans]